MMNSLILVAMLICPNEKDWYSKHIYYSEQACREAAYGTAINYYLSTGKKCEWKCIKPDYEPKEIK